MISIFGAMSLVVLIVCVAALVLHVRVLKKRSRVDDAMAEFDELLRDRLEIYLDLAGDAQGDFEDIENICESYVLAETRQIIKSWAKIEKSVAPLKSEINKNEALAQNAKDIDAMVRAYNNNVAVYNDSIAHFPGKIIALAVGFTAVKVLHFSYMTEVGTPT